MLTGWIEMFRHLPPTATPLPLATLAGSLRHRPDADERLRIVFTEYIGTEACFTADSGRTALYLLLTTLSADAPDRRKVLLPAYTCPSLVKVIHEANLQAIPVDLDPTTLEMKSVAQATTLDESTLAVIHVHPFGIPQPLDDLCTAAHAAGVVVIEDVAQSMGAGYDGRKAGSRGDFGLFSLGPGKPLSAGGGGLVTVNHAEDVERVAQGWVQLPPVTRRSSIVALGRLAAFCAAFEPHGWWLATKAGAQKVGDNEENWGFRLRGLTQGQAAVAAKLLPQLDEFNAARRTNARALLSAIGDSPECNVPCSRAPDATSIYLRLPLIFHSPRVCDAVHSALNQAGIGAGRMYRQPLTTLFPGLGDDAPGARHVADSLLTLPTHHYVTPNDIEQIAGIIRDRAVGAGPLAA